MKANDNCMCTVLTNIRRLASSLLRDTAAHGCSFGKIVGDGSAQRGLNCESAGDRAHPLSRGLQHPRGWVAAELAWLKLPGNFGVNVHPLQQLIAFNIPVRWFS